MLSYGTKLVGGVTPGKGGQEVHGVPVFDTVQEAKDNYSSTSTSAIFVPPSFAKEAVFEALEAGIKTVVLLPERVPQQDMLEVIAAAREYKAIVIGPNSIGIISPGKALVGMIGARLDFANEFFTKGKVGVLSRSGGLTAVFTLMGCIAAGASKVYMSEIQPGRARRCKEFGATEVFNPVESNLVEEIIKRTDGVGVDVAIDCTGIESAINDCFTALKKRGMYVQSGLTVDKIKVDPFEWAFKDLNMVGIWAFNSYDWDSTVNLISAGRLPVEKSVTKVIRVDDIVAEGFEVLTADKTGKETKVQVSFE
jgi:hypothetical protein